MNKEKITREHRTLDDTDLRDINNTFKLIEKTLDSFRESNDRKFDSLKSELKSDIYNMEVKFDSVKSDIATIKWTIGFVIACISIAMTISKFFS